MKKTSLLVLPLAALLLTSCATTIKGSDMPELTKNPGYIVKLVMSSTISGDNDLIKEAGGEKGNQEIGIEIYSNFIKLSEKSKVDGKNESTTAYVMLKNEVTYILNDENGKKSKQETPDPTGLGFAAGSAFIVAMAKSLLSPALALYSVMSNYQEPKESDSGNESSLKRLGNVYILNEVETGKDGIKEDNVAKLTIKNDYFSALEVTSVLSKDGKKATNKASFKYTFGSEKQSYSESKMPNPESYA